MNKRTSGIIAMALVTVFVLAGCGADTVSSTAPQDTVPPAAVVGVDAEALNGPSPSVVLTWNAGTEADLAGYRVYRSTAGAAAVLVATTTSASWRDISMTPGVDQVYQVSAVDVSANESARTSAGKVVVLDWRTLGSVPGSGKDQQAP